MVIWGGDNYPTYPNTGGIYDPATDTWTPTTTAGVPSGRESHTAVWTGSRMIVWGGELNGTYLDTGGAYDPAAGTWSATTTVGAPAGRGAHTAVWTGSQMVVWGGFALAGSSTVPFDTGGIYLPPTYSADLAIAKTDGQASAVPGQDVTYTITVSNAGPSAAIALVVDTFPASLTGITWNCVGSGGSCAAAAAATSTSS